MPPTLPIRDIRNSNPAWFRTDMGDMDGLTASVKEHGVQKPVLLRSDFLLIDGARRIEAATNARLKDVPVKIINTWEEVMKAFRPADPDCYPMDWPTLLDFWYTVLKPIHQDFRIIAAVTTRRSGGPTGKKPSYSGFVNDLSELYNSPPGTIKLIRDHLARIRRVEKQYPIFAAGVFESLPTGEAARNLYQGRVIKAVFQNLITGEYTEEEALAIFRSRLRQAGMSQRPRVPRAEVHLDTSSTIVSATFVRNLLEVLTRIGLQAREFRNFKITAEDAEEFNETISTAVSEVNGLRRRLKLAAGTPKKTRDTAHGA